MFSKQKNGGPAFKITQLVAPKQQKSHCSNVSNQSCEFTESIWKTFYVLSTSLLLMCECQILFDVKIKRM